MLLAANGSILAVDFTGSGNNNNGTSTDIRVVRIGYVFTLYQYIIDSIFKR